jgi:hypothetical protein
MTNEETDTALLLENELKRRVREVVRAELALAVSDLVKKEIEKNKQAMMTEITLAIGKSLQSVEKDGRKPLWETDLTEFGLTKEELNSHMIEGNNYAIRKQT